MVAGQCLLATAAFHALVSEHEGPNRAAFHDFMQQHGRQFAPGSEEYHQRLALFARRAAEVEAHNAKPGRLWTAGINWLSDRTDAELMQLHGWRGAAAPAAEAGRAYSLYLNQLGQGRPLPEESMNWTMLPAAKQIKDQGECSSCWAVSSAKTLELHHQIYRPKHPRTFSAQELVSCMPNPHKCGGKGGCEGATAELAFDWVMKHGLAQEDEVPYKGVTGTCPRSGAGSGATAQLGRHSPSPEDLSRLGVREAPVGAPGLDFGMCGWERLPSNSYAAVLRAVYEHGPMVVAVSAEAWHPYQGGIFDGCPRDAIPNHGVVLMGYGKDPDSGTLFWDIQNSWGPSWGEGGHMRVLRHEGDGERCGVDRHPEKGIACEGGPKEVKVCGMCAVLFDAVLPRFQCGILPEPSTPLL
eukprot:CAMPEP_0179080254 /NCGR_PEP_ID=MMETSP0796-20121207/36057_1 /TAXON_ID=73915 /ORGANISM="Pyrodinium bahamense, Strain pbaha01" /LENGTH=410 /DNA_ID=CAMNT_0020777603 /DNA_START=63 /DNA_END=1295 /DNA_ORIENTATION=+